MQAAFIGAPWRARMERAKGGGCHARAAALREDEKNEESMRAKKARTNARRPTTRTKLQRMRAASLREMLEARELPVPEKARKQEIIDVLLPALREEEEAEEAEAAGKEAAAEPLERTDVPARQKRGRKRHRALTGMELTFIGTSAGSPTAERNPSSLALRLFHELMLVDCGDGTLRQLMRSELSYGKVTRVLVTHMHGDHVFGLPSVLTAILHSRPQAQLDVYGPEGLYDFLASAFHFSQTCLPGRLVINELVGRNQAAKRKRIGNKMKVRGGVRVRRVEPDWGTGSSCEGKAMPDFDAESEWHDDADLPIWTLFRCPDDKVTVRAVPVRHKVPCFGFVAEEEPSGGHILPGLCTNLGLPPGPKYKDLKEGRPVQTENGRWIFPEEVMTEPTPGRKLCVLGDTCYSGGPAQELARNADLLVHEATFREGLEKKAIRVGHSTAAMAGKFAREVGAKQLTLTHFGGRYAPVFGESEGIFDSGEDSSDRSLAQEAKAHFGTGPVLCAQDFLTVSVAKRKNHRSSTKKSQSFGGAGQKGTKEKGDASVPSSGGNGQNDRVRSSSSFPSSRNKSKGKSPSKASLQARSGHQVAGISRSE